MSNEPHYYSAIVRKSDDVVIICSAGPFLSWTEIMRYHTGVLAHQPQRLGESLYEHRVLFDLSSAGWMSDQVELGKLIYDDPILHAIFELGRQHGIAALTRLTPDPRFVAEQKITMQDPYA